MTEELKSMAEVREVNSGFPYTEPIRQFKEHGGKVIATQCAYIPEEVVWAAGALPVRMTGDSGQMELEDANSYLYVNTCSYCRTCFQLALEGKWEFLDGYMSSATCDGARRLADVWEKYIDTPVINVLGVPRKKRSMDLELYLSEIRDMKEDLEEHLAVEITEESLWEAIRLFNRTRELLREIYELRKADCPPIWGYEIMEVLNAGLRMPKDRYNALLEKLLDELMSSNRHVDGEVRLMVSGSPLNSSDFFRALEQHGGVVVTDDLCMGTQFWWKPVDTSIADPMEALATHYLNDFTCARMVPCGDRFEEVLGLIKEWRVDGVVSEIMPYCVLYAHDQPMLRSRLEEEGIPLLELEVEYGTGFTGQIMTRAQAFVEMLSARKGKSVKEK